MKVKLSNINYKGKYFEEVEVEIPRKANVDLANDGWLVRYYIQKELDRMIG